jgi:hypothetical protein
MYGLKAQVVASSKVTAKSVQPVQRRRSLHPVFFHMGPVALCITCVLLISLMAVLYLSQVGQVVTANHQLQSIRSEQAPKSRLGGYSFSRTITSFYCWAGAKDGIKTC